MPQLVESCGMFFLCPFLPFRFLFSDFLEKNMPFILFCLRFVLSLQYQSIYAAFCGIKNIRR